MEVEEFVAVLSGSNKVQKNMVLRQIYTHNFPKVLSYVRSNNGSEEQAKDIFQDAIVIMYRNIKDNKFNKNSSVHSYLFGIAKNLWLQHLSKLKTHQKFEENSKKEISEIVEEQNSFQVFNRHLLEQLIALIGTKCKDLLALYYYEEQSISIIKETLKLGSEQAVRNKIYRCMKKLRNACKEQNISMDHFTIDE